MSSKKMTLMASLGASLEYYDFVIYGLLANYIGQNFFPHHNPIVNTLEAFSIFALGYLARPLGGIIFGNQGDRIGRKPIFLFSILLMAFSTLIIGLLPDYHSIGITATIGLIFLRILQGMAFGAEIPGTVTFLVEHTQHFHRGRHIGFALSSISLGASLGSGIIFIISQNLSSVQMVNYGWRIPFLLGGSLALVGFFIRKKLQETPVFLAYQQNNHKPNHIQPILYLLQRYPRLIFLGISISLLSACFIVFFISLPSFLQQFYHYHSGSVYLSVSLGFLWSALILPLFGWLSDKLGRPAQLAWTAGLLGLGGVGLFALLNLHTLWSLAVFIMLYQTFVASLANCYLPMLAEIFPTHVRFSGTAFCINIVYSIAAFAPYMIIKFSSFNHGMGYIYIIFMLLCCLTVIGSLIILAHKKILD